MISAIVVDDDVMARESMKALLKKLENVELAGAFESAFEAKSFLKENKPFLNITT